MSLCETEPKAFFKSKNEIETGRPFCFACSMIEVVVKMCSIVPFTPWRKPFCVEESIIPFCKQNFSSRLERIL